MNPRRSAGTTHATRYGDLLRALQVARGKLAVAIATESKTTSQDRWRYYRETEDRMRRYLRKIRLYGGGDPEKTVGWTEVVDALRNLPLTPEHGAARQSHAQKLCRQVREALAPLKMLDDQ